MTHYSGNFYRANDQTVSTTTLTADDVLTFQMDPSRTYELNLKILFSVTGGLLPSYSWSLTGPGGTSFVVVQNSLMLLGINALTVTTNSAFGVTNTSASLGSSYGILTINAFVKTGDEFGDFNFNFGCSGGSTSVKNLNGSRLRYDYEL